MSAGSINGKPLSVGAFACSSLEVGGQPITPSGVVSLAGSTGGALTGALTLAGAGGVTVTGAGTTLTITGGGGGGGITALRDDVTPTPGATTSLTPVIKVGAVTNTSAATSLAFVATANDVTLAGNIQSSASGGGPLAWGTVVVPATPGTTFNVYPTGGTAPASPAAALVAQGGTLAPSASFTTANFMTANWANGTFGGTGATAPGAGALAVGRPGSTQSYTTISIGAGAFVAGQVLYWVLWAL